MRKWPVIGGLLALLWLFVRGVSAEPAAIAGESLIGLVLGLSVAFFFRRLYATDVRVGRALQASPYAILFAAVFFKDLLTANFDVAYRVLAPSRPIEPDVVVIPLRIRTDAAITTIANAISLTPGTLTMDYDERTNSLYVHGITGKNRRAVVEPVRNWEEYLLVIFDEEGKPGDPVPEVPLANPGGERRGD